MEQLILAQGTQFLSGHYLGHTAKLSSWSAGHRPHHRASGGFVSGPSRAARAGWSLSSRPLSGQAFPPSLCCVLIFWLGYFWVWVYAAHGSPAAVEVLLILHVGTSKFAWFVLLEMTLVAHFQRCLDQTSGPRCHTQLEA